jgi:protease I
MAERLAGRRVAILAADGVERVELVEPRDAVTAEGASTELLSVAPGEIQSTDHDIYPGVKFPVDRLVGEASIGDYDALILPGGAVNPDHLRQNPDAVAFVRDFMAVGKPVGAICHAPWTLVEADVVHGRRLTSFPSIRTDVRNAGATVVDEQVVVDDALVSSRGPRDLPAFCAAIVDVFETTSGRS